jgi:hypothetical protein
MEKKRKRPRGFGSAYRRGNVWWIRYQYRGEQVQEPGGLDGRGARTKEEAEEKLKQRYGEIAAKTYAGPEAERLTVGDLLDAYGDHLETGGAKSVKQVESHLVPVREAFGRDRAVTLTTARLREYITHQLEADYAPATVNRGLQALRAAFNLARKEDRLHRVPYFPLRTAGVVSPRRSPWSAATHVRAEGRPGEGIRPRSTRARVEMRVDAAQPEMQFSMSRVGLQAGAILQLRFGPPILQQERARQPRATRGALVVQFECLAEDRLAFFTSLSPGPDIFACG